MKKAIKTNKQLEIRRLPYTRMLKAEMAEYAVQVIDIVQKHTTDTALFNPLFVALLAKEPQIELLSLNYGVDTHRLKLENIKRVMMLTISAFKLKVRMISKSNPLLDLHVIQNAIDSYLRYFNRCRNDKELNHKIGGFLELMDANTEFAAAVNKFDLLDAINEIKKVNEQYNKVLIERVHLLAKRPKFSSQGIIKKVFIAIDNLFKGIEVAQLISNTTGADESCEGNYTQLINKLRELSDLYYKSYSIRKANNKRKLQENQLDEDELELKKMVHFAETSVEVETATQEDEKSVGISSNDGEISEDMCESEFEITSSTEEVSVGMKSNGVLGGDEKTNSGADADMLSNLLQEQPAENAVQPANNKDLNDTLHKPNLFVSSLNSVSSDNQAKEMEKESAKKRLLLTAPPPCNS